uniref:Uncharacterized protein n=1 Tax=Romanomermis culicivorax TaxID=13658 RepID=A0A915HIK5_ROMCU
MIDVAGGISANAALLEIRKYISIIFKKLKGESTVELHVAYSLLDISGPAMIQIINEKEESEQNSRKCWFSDQQNSGLNYKKLSAIKVTGCSGRKDAIVE